MNAIGKLFTKQLNPDFTGYGVIAIFEKRLMVSEKLEEDVYSLFETRADVAKGGGFEISLPALEEIKDKVIFKALAPNGEMLKEKEYEKNKIEKIEIEVEYKPSFSIGKPQPRPKLKMEGKVLDFSGKTKISDRQVLIWCRDLGAEPGEFRVVIETMTDNNGQFREEIPSTEFEEAYGTVQDYPDEKIPVSLESRRLPRRVILVVGNEANKKKDDEECGCEGPKDKECIDFTTPNRTLEEFNYYSIVRTTDPEIKGLTLEEPKSLNTAILTKMLQPLLTEKISSSGNPASALHAVAKAGLKKVSRIDVDIIKDIVAKDPDGFTPAGLLSAEKASAVRNIIKSLDGLKKKIPWRGALNADNPVDWDDAPTFYQATSISHGHILHLKQVWKADGYSIGDLLYSLPLAPRQRKQIAVVDWDRREDAARIETAVEAERIDAMISHDRDISEVTSGVLRENVRGGSEASTWAAGGGFGLAIGPLVLGAAGGGGGASSSAWQDSSRSMSASFLNQLRDKTIQSAASVRSQRTTVVQSVRQGESMRVTTEVVGNPNHCHAITIEYFEVLRHFQISQELADVQECLFVPLMISRFDRDKTLRWREPLRRFLRNRALNGAFDAMERRKNNYEGSDLPAGRYAEENIEYLDGEVRITFKLVRPEDNQDDSFNQTFWNPYAPFLWDSPFSIFNQYLSNAAKTERDRIFQRDIAPRIAEDLVQKLRFHLITSAGKTEVQLDPTLVSNYTPNVPLYVSLRASGPVPAIPREQIIRFEISTDYNLPTYSKTLVTSASVRYRTKHLSQYLFRDFSINNDLVKGDPVQAPAFMNSQELRNPRNEDAELEKKILAHLNEHIEYYHRAIWLSMDANRRYMLLDGFIAPNSNGRSVASVIENRLIGIVGNCLVMPISRGFNLDPTYNSIIPARDENGAIIKDENGEIVYEYKSLLELYSPGTQIPPMRISVPTRGVYAESVMGKCNSCEEYDGSRNWALDDAAFDLTPAAISAVSAESRRTEPGSLTTKDFPAPMINIQNAPEAPAPTGLAPLMQLLGTPNLFKDITGLEQNQKNALAAFQSALSASQSFAGEAVKVRLQEMLMNKMGNVKQAIQQAKKEGLITDTQANELTYNALKGLIGDKKEEKEPALIDNPQVQKLIKSGEEKGKDVSINTPGSGNIEVKNPGTGNGRRRRINYSVPGIVPSIQQPSGLACWATVATIIMCWRDQQSYSIQAAMDIAGTKWRTKFDNNEVLLWTEHDEFATDAGFIFDYPQSYTIDRLELLLRTFGPIVAITDEDPTGSSFTHARVISGIRGDGTEAGTYLTIHDPADGQVHVESVETFRAKFEEAAGRPEIQVFYCREK